MNMRTDENGRRIVERREDIPAFASESEERAFWETHTMGGVLLDEMGAVEDTFLPSPRPPRAAGAISLQREQHRVG